MLRPFYFIWKQLRGPQIKAIIQATYDWVVNMFDKHFDYFNNLNIDTATSEHLSWLGLVARFPRALVKMPNETYFWFTDGIYHNHPHGLSDVADRSEGGKLSDAVTDRVMNMTTRLPNKYYKQLLRAYIESAGEEGSLRLLDDLSYTTWKIFQRIDPAYRLDIIEQNTGNRSCGDILVDLGSMYSWEEGNLAVRAMYDVIDESLYRPDTRLIIHFNEE